LDNATALQSMAVLLNGEPTEHASASATRLAARRTRGQTRTKKKETLPRIARSSLLCVPDVHSPHGMQLSGGAKVKFKTVASATLPCCNEAMLGLGIVTYSATPPDVRPVPSKRGLASKKVQR